MPGAAPSQLVLDTSDMKPCEYACLRHQQKQEIYAGSHPLCSTEGPSSLQPAPALTMSPYDKKAELRVHMTVHFHAKNKHAVITQLEPSDTE
eukprot:1150287-Pelagomonas_calceolata.AAC.10